MWMLSEPEVSMYDHRWLAYIFVLLLVACVGCAVFLIYRFTTAETGSRAVYGWAVAIVIMSWLIAFFSSPNGSSGGMISMATHLLRLNRAQAETLIFFVRKSVHLSFYGLLGWVGFRWSMTLGAGLRRAIAFALLLVLAHASFDEGRQTFFPDRTASILDVVLDCCGATILVCLSAVRRTNASTPLRQHRNAVTP
jgi:VanZ family protein